MFAKNGTDATTMCCTIARAQTGRRKILVATGAYHGAAPWCTPRPAGVDPAGPRQPRLLHLQRPGQRAAGRRRGGRRPGGHRGQPVQARRRVRPGTGRPRVRPRPARAVRRHRGRADPRRRALRVPAAPRRSSWEPVGVDPDLSRLEQGDRERPRRSPRCWATTRSATGRGRCSSPARSGSPPCPMAAAIATIARARDEERAVEAMERTGTALRDGILAQARVVGPGRQLHRPAGDALPHLRRGRGPRAGRRVRGRRPCAAASTCTPGTTGSSPPP